MDLEETETRNDYAGEGQQQFNRPTDRVVVESYSYEKWEAASRGRGQFGNPEERERPMLKPAPSNS
jgi:hypothetical protein